MDRMLENYRVANKFSWPLLLVAASWFYFVVVLINKNVFGYYLPRFWGWGILVVPLLYFALRIFVGGIILPRSYLLNRRSVRMLLLFGLALAGFLTWLFPPPFPMLIKNHTLRLVSTGELGADQKGSQVIVAAAHSIDGKELPLEAFSRSGDWIVDDRGLVAAGKQPGAIAVYTGDFRGGVEMDLLFGKRAGILLIDLDGKQKEIDLSLDWENHGTLVIQPEFWQSYSLLEQAFVVLGCLLYFLAIAAAAFLLALVLEMRALLKWLEILLFIVLYLVIFVFYARMKTSYVNFSTERIYGDTLTYLNTAQYPVTSARFWFSDRTFPLPLFYKMTGVTLDNVTQRPVMDKVSFIQARVSMVCWAILGLVVASILRKRWLGPVAFAVILFFSLGLEISLWDYLMLSESLSFSLFALLIALWLGLGQLASAGRRSLWLNIYLVALIFVTAFYAFMRDSNVYLVLCGAIVFILAGILKRTPPGSRYVYWIYAGFVLGLFVFQNMTIRLGDRWQIHIFDNLVFRIIKDEEALKYFEASGLPVDEKVLALSNMTMAEYHQAIFTGNEPSYIAVRDWVSKKGQSVYMRYLLEHPDKSLLDPLQNFDQLINGNNLEYRYELFPGQPVPGATTANDRKVYQRHPVVLVVLLVLQSFGVLLYWIGRKCRQPAWLVITVMLLSIPLLALIIWNANPLEIERHAVQIGIQFRLGGWLAMLLWLDWLLLKTLPEPVISTAT